MPRKGDVVDLVGRRFVRLQVIAADGMRGRHAACRVRCDCGVERSVLQMNLVHGRTRSCGCLRREVTRQSARKAAWSTYRVWTGIVSRVLGSTSAHLYARRGIDMDPRWRASFDAFLADMGERPSPAHSVDRIDNARGYWPDNCRWATSKTQARNRRSNRMLTHDGETASVAEWAERRGLKPACIIARLNAGKTTAEALAPSARRAA